MNGKNFISDLRFLFITAFARKGCVMVKNSGKFRDSLAVNQDMECNTVTQVLQNV